MSKLIFFDGSSHSKVLDRQVYIKDIASIYTEDKEVMHGVETMLTYTLQKPKEKKVISLLDLIELIQNHYPDYEVCSIGEKDLIVEWAQESKWDFLKVLGVCFISFFGTAFTIMAFHNDIGITGVFEEIYRITGGDKAFGIGVIEVTYCIGLFLGITIFFNHLGKKRRENDPTPIMVAMNNYERDVNETVINHMQKEGSK
ncbi:MAG: stage V sporulation protein AA [Lachnospiraceae bacterium]